MYPTDSSSTSSSPLVTIIWLAVAVVLIASLWKVFTKAGRPGWAALIPFYSTYIMIRIAGRPGWWLLLMFVPLVNVVVWVLVTMDLAKAFGKSSAFGIVALLLFSFVGFPILGFGSAQYVGPAAPAIPAVPTDTPPAAPQA